MERHGTSIVNRTAGRRSAGRRLLVAVALAALAAGLLAAPAAAQPASTALDASALSTNVVWGKSTVLTATLMDVDRMVALGGLWVRVEWSSTGVGGWNLLAEVTTDDAQYFTGQYAAAIYPVQRTFYRFVFLGNGSYGPSTSTAIQVDVRPFVGKPAVPKAVKRGKRFRISGMLKPRFTAGAKTVRVTAQVRRGGKWRVYKRWSATNANSGEFTRYSVRVRINAKGTYRFRATTKATADWAAGRSVYSRILKVR